MNLAVQDQHYLMALDTLRSGGGTYGRDTYRSPALPYRYFVAVGAPHSRAVHASAGAEAVPQIVHALRSLADERGVWGTENALGTWVHNGFVYVDIVESVGNVDKALELAAERGQQAIWDSAERVTIPVPESVATAA